MTEETKELINCIRVNLRHNKCFGGIDEIECKLLLDCITNLQQDLDKANDIIQKDRQFYKCRMDEYVELKKENERLKGDEKFFTECGFTNIEQLSIAYNDYKSKKGKTTNYYLKTLAKNKSMPDEATQMFNLLEGNK